MENNSTDRPGWKFLELLNPVPKLRAKGLLEGYWIDKGKQKYTKTFSLLDDSPWDFINNDPERKICNRLQMAFQVYNLVPTVKCYNCWKVVVKPNTLRQLFDVRDLMKKMSADDPAVWCKCGIEIGRYYVPGIYGGYFYTDSKSAGKSRWKQARKLVSKHISPEIDVYLKRYCTEYELTLGDSGKYELPPHAQHATRMLLGVMDLDIPLIDQPAWVKTNVYHQWIKYAYKYGDPVDRRQIEIDHNDGEPLYIVPRRYKP